METRFVDAQGQIAMEHAETSRVTDLVARAGMFADARPLTLTPMPGGLSNRTYMLETSRGARYTLRIDTDTSKLFHRSREDELAVMRVVSDKGLAPRPVLYEPAYCLTVFEYVPGRLVKSADVGSEHFASALRQLLTEVYAHRLHGKTLRLTETIDAYNAQLVPQLQPAYARLQRLQQRLRSLFFALDALKNEYCLTHLDLGPGNLLWHVSGHLVALDWEYAHRFHPMLDLAIMANNWQLADRQMRAIAPANAVVRWDIFPQIRVVARYLEALWYAVQACHDQRHHWQPMAECCLEEVEERMKKLYL
jgi:thiamine kinase-like enzyme